MTIKVQGPDGAVHTFPDNAKPDQITEALKSVYQAPGDGQSFGQRAEAAATAANVDTGPDTQGPLGLYADTVKQFPANLMNAQNHSYAMLRSGLHDLGQGDMSGLIGAGIGGLGFVGAPVTAALTPALKPVNTFVSQPLENATGGMIPAPVTTAALSALIPGMGITRGPMSVRPSVPLGMSRPAGEVLLRQLSTDDTLSGTGAARIRQGGPNAMVADAGPAAANLLDTAMQRSGPGATQARQAVEGRAAQANTDLTGALDRAMGPAEGVDTQQTGIRTRTAPIREQAYNAAYRQPIDYTTIHGRNIERLVDRVPPEAITQANKMMRAEGSASRQIKATINDDGTVSFEQLPDVRQLDYITRGLNEVAQGAEGQGAMRGTTAVGRIYGNLSQEIRGNLREAVPEYGHALDTAADPIQRIQAIEFGATILNPKVTRDQVAQQFQGMGAGERRAAISGLRSQIDEISANVKSMASDPNVDARQLRETLKSITSAAAREKIAAAIGPAATRALMRQVGQSARALELRAQVAVNSRTFGRKATAAQVSAQAEPGIVGLAMEGHPLSAARKFIQSITKMTPERRLAMEDRIYGQIADALTRHRGRDAEQFLGQLRSEITLRAGQRARDARRLGSAPVNSTQTITQSTAPTALPQLQNLQAQPQQQQPDPNQAARPALPVNQAAWNGSGGPLDPVDPEAPAMPSAKVRNAPAARFAPGVSTPQWELNNTDRRRGPIYTQQQKDDLARAVATDPMHKLAPQGPADVAQRASVQNARENFRYYKPGEVDAYSQGLENYRSGGGAPLARVVPSSRAAQPILAQQASQRAHELIDAMRVPEAGRLRAMSAHDRIQEKILRDTIAALDESHATAAEADSNQTMRDRLSNIFLQAKLEEGAKGAVRISAQYLSKLRDAINATEHPRRSNPRGS